MARPAKSAAACLPADLLHHLVQPAALRLQVHDALPHDALQEEVHSALQGFQRGLEGLPLELCRLAVLAEILQDTRRGQLVEEEEPKGELVLQAVGAAYGLQQPLVQLLASLLGDG